MTLADLALLGLGAYLDLLRARADRGKVNRIRARAGRCGASPYDRWADSGVCFAAAAELSPRANLGITARVSELSIATWNVNSLRAREAHVVEWLRRNEPDVLCLQETKVQDEEFPSDTFSRLGYQVARTGQRTYNGVAILSKSRPDEIEVGLEGGFASSESRLISVRLGALRVFCAYVPNGKSVDNPAFEHKLQWLRELRQTVAARAQLGSGVVVCGDFNIAPEARDVYDPKAFEGHVHFHPAEHAALDELKGLGLHDALRLVSDAGESYTWWDYRAGAFRRNRGLRIDYLLVSQSLADRCEGVEHHRSEREKVRPSDHVPVLARFR